MNKGYIYLIWAEGTNRFKIGKTKGSPYRRLKNLSTGSSQKLELVGVLLTDTLTVKEKEFHQRFAKYRTEGEWFQFPPTQIKVVLDMFDSELFELLKRSEIQLENDHSLIECFESQNPMNYSINFFQDSIHLKTLFFEQTGWIEESTHTWGWEHSWSRWGNYFYCWIEPIDGEKVTKKACFCKTKELQFRNGIFTEKVSGYSQTKLGRITERILNQEPCSEILPRLGNRNYFKKKTLS
jgi:hypothetical protein